MCSRETFARKAGLDQQRRQRLEVVEHPAKSGRGKACAGSGRVVKR